MNLEEALVGPVELVAPRLLGAFLTHAGVTVRLTEVEAYGGAADPGSHAYRGPTGRNQVMFGPAGHLYVYFTYGMHTCANVVCGPEGDASATLLRAGEVVSGIEQARERRPGARDRDLARGPARLCRALDIRLDDNGAGLCGDDFSLSLPETPPTDVATGPRVGLRGAPERPWRFWASGEPSVSTYRPAKGLARPS
ncbi:DNA-3-methyladenine glycosylase [Nocardioides sp. Iso805N]|uniref:DNA-3-methyladenine glycosylase n=1 Tax=Nocardioides sp. Iso805N TaxID=1283287 RepID=UPI00037D2BC6|nr:DNA-3-methyladenine glycosylase [Nocardioides sp. Iso805N]